MAAIPADVQNYRTLHPVFPHQSTANQWLMNRNSKAAGNLGRISAETALKLAGSPDELRAMPTSKVFESLLALL